MRLFSFRKLSCYFVFNKFLSTFYVVCVCILVVCIAGLWKLSSAGPVWYFVSFKLLLLLNVAESDMVVFYVEGCGVHEQC